MDTQPREVELVVISDIHLGIYGCHAKELCRYLSGIRPRILILNGDIIDIWQFSKRYFPKSHTRVVRKILKLAGNGTQVYYLTGNHDEALRKYAGFSLGNLTVDNKLLLTLNGKTHWFFHGDVFDLTMQHSRWLAKLGGKGYDLLIILNRWVNVLLERLGKEKMSFSKKVKAGVKKAVQFISDFENTVAEIAADKHFDVVCCGHIHQPCIKEISSGEHTVLYLNSGDWVESLTALEYHNGQWELYRHPAEEQAPAVVEDEDEPLSAEIFPLPFPLPSVGK
ncbi:UDP-2,3-diacylglucosamine diphosphatase [Compostibacter hankyongensis]|uniref:UDP-2,3-diacylglucosamine diphosphatase n=1 Tax=Compostibacter hankyongensis TaxID=1007089 RepID=A0ABP8FEW0_9BACT